MGYFSSGTEGMIYEDELCSRCIHHGDCAVWDAHIIFSYDLCNEKESPGKQILDMLIPMEDDIYNLRCKMFAKKK